MSRTSPLSGYFSFTAPFLLLISLSPPCFIGSFFILTLQFLLRSGYLVPSHLSLYPLLIVLINTSNHLQLHSRHLLLHSRHSRHSHHSRHSRHSHHLTTSCFVPFLFHRLASSAHLLYQRSSFYYVQVISSRITFLLYRLFIVLFYTSNHLQLHSSPLSPPLALCRFSQLLIFYHNYQFGCRFIISDCSPCVFSPLLVSSLLLILYDNFPVCYRCPVFSLTFGFPLPPCFPSAHLLSPPSGCYLSLWLPPSFLFFAL